MGLFDIFSTKPAQNAATSQITGLNQGYTQLADLYGQGRDALSTSYDKGSGALTDTYNLGYQGSQAYADATGANGTAGLSNAKTLFEATPGYTSGLDLTLDKNDRRAASRGMLGSGNTIADTAKLATDYSNTHYNDYVKNLSPWLTTTSTAASSLGSLYGKEGDALNSSYSKQGDAADSTQTAVGKAQASSDLASYTASKNLWNGLIDGTKAVAQIAGSFAGA